MDELTPLARSGTELERELLRAGRARRASSQLRRRTLAALGFGALGLVLLRLLGGRVSAASSLLLGLGATTVVAVTAVLVTVQLGAPVAQPKLAASAARTTTRAARSEAAVASSAAVAPSASAAEVQDVAALPSAAPPPPSARAARPPSGSDLAAEVATLAEARAALARGDGASTLQAVARYHARFPRGHLQLEATVLRLEGLAASGRRAEARAGARAFIAAHPRSLLASRLEPLAR